MNDVLLDKVRRYWTRRAPGYAKVNREELAGAQRRAWLDTLERQLARRFPGREKAEIKILDVGTGPGFFAILLAEAGYRVTAVDYTPAMLVQARDNAGALAQRIRFLCMDGQALRFAENSFDAVLSRNLTWGLERPDRAYASWQRVLRPGGLFLNFDANWYHYLYDAEKQAAYDRDRARVRQRGMEDYNTAPDIDEQAMEEIVRAVSLGRVQRPHWDVQTLSRLHMDDIRADTEVWKRVWFAAEQVNFASTPLFMVSAVKR